MKGIHSAEWLSLVFNLKINVAADILSFLCYYFVMQDSFNIVIVGLVLCLYCCFKIIDWKVRLDPWQSWYVHQTSGVLEQDMDLLRAGDAYRFNIYKYEYEMFSL